LKKFPKKICIKKIKKKEKREKGRAASQQQLKREGEESKKVPSLPQPPNQ